MERHLLGSVENLILDSNYKYMDSVISFILKQNKIFFFPKEKDEKYKGKG